MRRVTVALFALLMIAAAVAAASLNDDTAKAAKKAVTNKECPVSGGPVSEEFRAEYKGQFVYVCCEGCVESFKKNPEKFVAKLSKEDQEAIKVNTTCPVSNEPVNQKLALVDEGRKVYFCCEGCVEKYKKDHPTAKAN